MGIFDKKPNVDKLVRKRDIDGLVKVVLNDKYPEVALQADDALEKIIKEDITKLVRKRDIDGLVKVVNEEITAYMGLASIKAGLQARDALVKIIKKSTRARDVDTIRHIFREGYNDPDVLYEAIISLGELRDKESVEALIEILRNPSFDNSLDGAVRSLDKIKDKRAIKPLIEVFRREDTPTWDNSSLHNLAMNALAKTKQAAVAPLIEALGDSDESVRRCAAETLGKIKDERVTEVLVKALKDKSPEVRDAAADALESLGKTKDKGVVGPLIDYARKSILEGGLGRADLSELVGMNLSELVGDKRAFELLTDDFLQAKESYVQDALLLALVSIVEASVRAGGGSVTSAGFIGEIEPLIAYVRNEKRIVEPLIAYIQNKNRELMRKGEAALILGEIEDRRAVEPLIEYLEQKAYGYTEVHKIIRALGKLGDEQAVRPLQRIVENPEKAIHWGYHSDDIYYYEQLEIVRELAEEAIGRIQKKKG